MSPALAPSSELESLLRRNAATCFSAERARNFDPARELSACRDLGVSLVALDDPGYPQLLKSIPDPPLVLYVKGSLAAPGPPLAFVGSRRPTAYGRRMSRALAGEAARAGGVVVSGLARGIDREAHEAALGAGGKTWAVLGSGLARLYPPEHEDLAREIAASGGCLISEFPLEAEPLAAHFPRRNRVLSGLAWGVVVVEGALKSGSLITARLALEQGREVFAVPGPADSPQSAAPHLLISAGAPVVRSMADVWAGLPPGCRPALSLIERGSQDPSAVGGREGLPEEHRKIIQLLVPDPLTVEELGQSSGLDLPAISNILLELELRDLVESLPGQRYGKKRS